MSVAVNKMKKHLCIIVIVVTAFAKGAHMLDQLNDEDYARMPPVYHMDEFGRCLEQSGGTYCTGTFSLKSDEPNGLLSAIHEYSKHSKTHFNHSNLRYGLCMTERCKRHYRGKEMKPFKLIFEECLDEFFLKKYNLKSAVTEYHCNEFQDNNVNLDIGDICVGLIVFALLSIAALATFVDIYMLNESTTADYALLNFSLKRNWLLLKSTSVKETDKTKTLFRSLHGIKVFLFCIVVLGHSGTPIYMAVKDVKGIEESYSALLPHVVYTGTTIVQTYFVMSGMLLAYKIQCYEEKKKINYSSLHTILALRWLRLTPSYALTIAIISTWLRYMKPGPLWEFQTGEEINDCRQRGWLNIIYFNNYIDDSQCLPHTWYLAADTQLFFFGALLVLLTRRTKSKVLILAVTFFIGMIIPLIHIYMQDLEPLIIISPKTVNNFFGNDPTYNVVYKSGHTNIASYVVGIAVGYLIYSLKRDNFTTEKYKKYRFIYWSLIPACLSLMMLGNIFYNDTPRPSIYIRLLYAMFAKPLFAVMVATLILGMALKYEDIYRNIFGGKFWFPLSRLSYNAFIVHYTLIRLYISTTTELMEDNPWTRGSLLAFFITTSFLVAIPIWLFVDAPIAGLVARYTSRNAEGKAKSKIEIEMLMNGTNVKNKIN